VKKKKKSPRKLTARTQAVFEQSVIDDVLRHAREEFMNEGLEDSLVQELQQVNRSR